MSHSAFLSPVVKYHGLARRYRQPLGFLMRPLLNSGTLCGHTGAVDDNAPDGLSYVNLVRQR